MKRLVWSIALLVIPVGFVAFAASTNGQERDSAPNRDEVEGMMDAYILSKLQDALELTDEQSAALDKIFRKALPQLRESMRRLNAEERTLSRLVGDMDVEEIDVTRQIDRVEATRSELSKTRILMVFRMHRVLTQRQRDGLDEWMERETDERGVARTRSGRC